MKVCVTCGAVITSHKKDTKQCGKCWQRARMFCLTCGKELDKRNQTPRDCRECWLKARPPHACETCGERVKRGVKHCMKCLEKKPHPCIDCGKDLLETGSYRSIRCWDCRLIFIRSRAIKTCAMAGCDRPHSAKGLCRSHHSAMVAHQRKHAGSKGSDFALFQELKRGSCQVCQYSALPPHIHRVIPGHKGGEYVAGNMIALCVRCHEEVHKGIRPCPEPVRMT